MQDQEKTSQRIHEHPTNLICPYDETPIVQYEAPYWKSQECPTCQTVYPITSSQKRVNEHAKKHFSKMPIRLEELDRQRATLIQKIQQAIEKGLIA